VHRKALVITLVPLALALGLSAGGTTPARAEEQSQAGAQECPEGMPSRSTEPTKPEPTKPAPNKASSTSKPATKPATKTGANTTDAPKPGARTTDSARTGANEKDATKPGTTSKTATSKSPTSKSTAPKTATSKSTASKTATAGSAGKTPGGAARKPVDADGDKKDDRTGNPIVDGWNDFVEGVGDLLGGGSGTSPSPTPSATTKPTPANPQPTKPQPTKPQPTKPQPTTTSKPTVPERPTTPERPATPPKPAVPAPGSSSTTSPGGPAGSASPSPAPSSSDIPCLGPRVYREAGAGDVPTVSVRGGTLETDRLDMTNSIYEGTTELQTAEGPLTVLKFSMDKAENVPFSLTIPEREGRTTLILSDKLITDGNVRFYTRRFEGKLYGLVPVTFTPEQPPPLTLPTMWFTDVTINLDFVYSDVLTADPLKITEKPAH
jgi:outer membrane biosynthesis protein TonB